jgi:hypothetical protein
MATQKIEAQHIEQSHPKVADTIISFVLPLLPAVINTVLADPAKMRKARGVLKAVRDTLNGADLG